jgi:putative toxin-antitoxin system antitoxin component (TIGR02293 family)
VVLDVDEATRLRNRLVPPATYKRRATTLKPEEGERVERLARVMALAEDAFGSADDARRFLVTPHPELAGERPLETAQTELGARQVEEVLWRMEYGLPV